MKTSSARKEFKRAKTFEEINVEEALFFGFLFALILMIFLVPFTSLMSFLNSLGATWAVSGFMIMLLSLQAFCSLLLGLRFRFSYRQFRLLAKFILAIDVGISALFIGYSYLIFTALAALIANPNSSVILVVGAMNVLLIGLLLASKKVFGERVGQWFRIAYFPNDTSLEVVSKSLKKAEYELARKNYEKSAEAFHSAAVVYANLERWREASENYVKAADAYSMNESSAFGASFLYCLAAATFILDGSVEDANKALASSNKILKSMEIPEKAKQRVFSIIALLAMICSGNVEKAEDTWESIERKMRRWSYPIVEEAVMLMRKNLEELRSQ